MAGSTRPVYVKKTKGWLRYCKFRGRLKQLENKQINEIKPHYPLLRSDYRTSCHMPISEELYAMQYAYFFRS